MKNTLYNFLVLLIVCAALISSCSKSNTAAPAPSIMGSWALTSSKILIVTTDTIPGTQTPITSTTDSNYAAGAGPVAEFLSSDSFSIINTSVTPFYSESGEYTVSGDTLTLLPAGGAPLVQQFTVTSTTLTTTDSKSEAGGGYENDTFIYTRK